MKTTHLGQESLDAIKVRAAESRAQNDRLTQLMPKRPAPSLRANFARYAVDLAMEHHSGLIRVAEAGEYGTAAALLRPILEAATIGYWCMYVASCEELSVLPTTPFGLQSKDVPRMLPMLRKLRAIFTPIGDLVLAFETDGWAKWLHKATHGTIPQLTRRGRGWTGDEVIGLLVLADLFAVLAACLETVIADNTDLAEYGFDRRDALGVESTERFGAEPLPPGMRQFPQPLTDGCGLPFDN
jgi:hypothetical protein